jgi:hypothetical protein
LRLAGFSAISSRVDRTGRSARPERIRLLYRGGPAHRGAAWQPWAPVILLWVPSELCLGLHHQYLRI